MLAEVLSGDPDGDGTPDLVLRIDCVPWSIEPLDLDRQLVTVAEDHERPRMNR
jgi:hypothetical protein